MGDMMNLKFLYPKIRSKLYMKRKHHHNPKGNGNYYIIRRYESVG